MKEYVGILIKTSLKVGPDDLIDNKSLLIWEVAWCWMIDSHLSEPNMIHFFGAYGYIYICIYADCAQLTSYIHLLPEDLFILANWVADIRMGGTLDKYVYVFFYIGGLVQERRNSNAVAMDLRLSCTKPLIYL